MSESWCWNFGVWCCFLITSHLSPITLNLGESNLGRLVDALALGGDEGRDKLR